MFILTREIPEPQCDLVVRVEQHVPVQEGEERVEGEV